MASETISWHAPEYLHRQRHPDWYWGVGVFGAALFVFAMMTSNILFAALVLVAVITIFILAIRAPRELACEVTPSGISIDELKYPYAGLHSFWIDADNEAERKLIIASKKTLAPYIIIPLSNDVYEESLRSYLKKYLLEEEHHEPFPQKIMEYLGF